MCIKILCHSTETYIQYNVQRGKQVKIYMQSLHHGLVLFRQSRNCFCYVQDNDIEGGILGWTMSPTIMNNPPIFASHGKNLRLS